jgi:hypothetical protein
MTSLADLHRAVQSTLSSKRLGRPVFVRYTLQGLDKPETIVPRLAQLTAVVRDWLEQPLDRVYANGTVAGGQVTLTLQFREGGTAQISFAQGQPRGLGVDLMVLGNHGAIYHDSGSANLWDEPATPLAEPPDANLQSVIERALKSGKPEAVAAGAKR